MCQWEDRYSLWGVGDIWPEVRNISHFNVGNRPMTALLVRSPFESGDSLISLADETKRDKLLAREEEERLLAACAERGGHLRPTIIGAIDTALRKSELCSSNGVISISMHL